MPRMMRFRTSAGPGQACVSCCGCPRLWGGRRAIARLLQQLIGSALTVSAAVAAAQGPATGAPEGARERVEWLQGQLRGAQLVGAYTVCGADANADASWNAAEAPLQADRYEIRSLEKLPTGDLWVITARIVYGGKDLTVPVPIEVQWAGKTPVLTLDDVTIPGLGTFGARVVLHEGRYAGTWRHDDKGGHMFGLVQRAAPADPTQKTDGAEGSP